MTFLQRLAIELIGPSEQHKGEERWPCPKCGHRGFHVRPPKPPYPIKFSCWSCGWWGDEHDLLAHYRPRLDYGQRMMVLDDLRRQWEALESSQISRGVGEYVDRRNPLLSEEARRVLGWLIAECLQHPLFNHGKPKQKGATGGSKKSAPHDAKGKKSCGGSSRTSRGKSGGR